jgi:phospholipid transport system substrate-binding protein
VEIPIDYRMKRIDGTWKVYDIIVENGVSLIKNYRVQFTSILQKESPGQLIQQLESKLAQQTGQTAIAN